MHDLADITQCSSPGLGDSAIVRCSFVGLAGSQRGTNVTDKQNIIKFTGETCSRICHDTPEFMVESRAMCFVVECLELVCALKLSWKRARFSHSGLADRMRRLAVFEFFQRTQPNHRSSATTPAFLYIQLHLLQCAPPRRCPLPAAHHLPAPSLPSLRVPFIR